MEEVVYERFSNFIELQESYMIQLQDKKLEIGDAFENLENDTKILREFVIGFIKGVEVNE